MIKILIFDFNEIIKEVSIESIEITNLNLLTEFKGSDEIKLVIKFSYLDMYISIWGWETGNPKDINSFSDKLKYLFSKKTVFYGPLFMTAERNNTIINLTRDIYINRIESFLINNNKNIIELENESDNDEYENNIKIMEKQEIKKEKSNTFLLSNYITNNFI